MRTKIVTVKVSYDTEETWEITLQEVKEIFQMMNNLKRNAIILGVEQGVNSTSQIAIGNNNVQVAGNVKILNDSVDYNDDGQNK
tara:strand:+ start:1148 stop:1399 length:252 start_codon:yes stop_codon:yes gene_type:complete